MIGNVGKQPLLLGLDVGTQGAKAVLVTPMGNVLGQGHSAYPVIRNQPAAAEQHPEKHWWQASRAAIATCLAQAGVAANRIAAIGCSAMGSNIALIDARGESLRPAVIWQDTRSSQVADRIDQTLRREGVWSQDHPPVTAHSFAAPWLWLRENEPETFARADLKLTTLGYLLHRLVGRHVVDRATASGMLPLYSLENDQWDETVCALLSIPMDELPEVVPSHTVVGSLTRGAALDLDLEPGIPVVAGTGDTMADLLSAGVVCQGQAAFTYGTIFTIMVALQAPPPDSFCFAHAIKGIYLLAGGVPAAGAALNWFRETFAQSERDQAELGGEAVYARLAQLAQAVPPRCEGLTVLPLFGQLSTERQLHAGAALLGLQHTHTREHIYRALIESLAYEVRRQLSRLSAPEVEDVIAIGGGIQNDLWTQTVSDVTGLRQSVATQSHGAPLGAAYLAGWGVGLFRSPDRLIDSWLGTRRTIIPDPERREIYGSFYPRYLEARSELATSDFP